MLISGFTSGTGTDVTVGAGTDVTTGVGVEEDSSLPPPQLMNNTDITTNKKLHFFILIPFLYVAFQHLDVLLNI